MNTQQLTLDHWQPTLDDLIPRATFEELRAAIDAAYAYVDLGSTLVLEAVDLTCDYLGIVDDRDRRYVRKCVEKRQRLAAAGQWPWRQTA